MLRWLLLLLDMLHSVIIWYDMTWHAAIWLTSIEHVPSLKTVLHSKCACFAVQIEQRRQVLRLSTMEPFKEPARPLSHWDFVLKEMRWMAIDFTEVSSTN